MSRSDYIFTPVFLPISHRITPIPASSSPNSSHSAPASLPPPSHPLNDPRQTRLRTRLALTIHLLQPSFAPRIATTLLVDPIPFLLHLPDVAFNFVYRASRDADEWLLWYIVSRDLDVARTLARHFFGAENVLWKEELEGTRVAMVLCGW